MDKNNEFGEAVDLPWGSEWSTRFVTNVGLITTTGPYGDNIMSSEWTHHVSYEPGMIAVCIRKNHATHDNILETKEFGVSLASNEQGAIASIAGTNSGKEIDKIAVLKELGFKFFKAKKIKALLVEGAALNLECRLYKTIELPERSIFIGIIVERYTPSEKTSLIYHSKKFWHFGNQLEKPSENELEKINLAIEKNKKVQNK